MDQMMVKVGDADLECFSHGAGTAIILLPGGSLATGYLSDLADALAEAGYRAIRVNPRGAGASTGPLTDLTLHDLAADVAGVIEALTSDPRSSSVTPSGTGSRGPSRLTARSWFAA